jgi:hypothetical protein
MIDIEQELIAYAGKNYAKLRRVKVAEIDVFDFIDIDDLTEALIAFRQKYSDLIITSEIDKFANEESSEARFTAFRMETPTEVETRIEKWRLEIIARETQRRMEYEKMKREFGDA